MGVIVMVLTGRKTQTEAQIERKQTMLKEEFEKAASAALKMKDATYCVSDEQFEEVESVWGSGLGLSWSQIAAIYVGANNSYGLYVQALDLARETLDADFEYSMGRLSDEDWAASFDKVHEFADKVAARVGD